MTTANNVLTSGQIQTQNVTTGIEVVGRVTGEPPNESVTCTLMPQVQDFTLVSDPLGGQVPLISTQMISTLVRVKDGETIAMGGLVRKNDNVSGQSIPILGDLPFIGALFRSQNKTNTDSELLIFITPTILREEGVDYGQGIGAAGRPAAAAGGGAAPAPAR